VEWISEVWKEVQVSIIAKSFLKCCLPNAAGGKQGDVLRDDSEQTGKGASFSENERASEGSLDYLSE
jgi:hypothetical protein